LIRDALWLGIGRVESGDETVLATNAANPPSPGQPYTLRVAVDEDGQVRLYADGDLKASHDFAAGDVVGSIGVGTIGLEARFDDMVAATGVAAELARSYYYAGSQRVAMRVSDGMSDTVYYLHGDHLGSTSLTTDEAGEVVARVLYYPYGETRWMTGTLTTDYGFTGQRQDSYTQLILMGARWYDAQTGRWICPLTGRVSSPSP
jgi:hypothetical protein